MQTLSSFGSRRNQEAAEESKVNNSDEEDDDEDEEVEEEDERQEDAENGRRGLKNKGRGASVLAAIRCAFIRFRF